MYFPKLQSVSSGRYAITAFGGLDLREGISDGSFAAMENLCSDGYPITTVRPRRKFVLRCQDAGGMIYRDGMSYTSGTAFMLGGWPVEMGLMPGEKTLVPMGAYIIILPDKKYINTLNKEDLGDLEATFVAPDEVQFSLSKADGSDYENVHIADLPPDEPDDGQYWLDTSVTPQVLKYYHQASEAWVQETSTCIRLSAAGIGKDFACDDVVSISGITLPEVEQLNGSALIYARDTDHIVIAGILDKVVTQVLEQGIIRVERKMPEMDFVVEAGNRLWGCRYGKDRNGTIVNEIYASKLGDFKNWESFRGLSTDSYRVSLGADGPFTGAVTHIGYPLFFREHYMHKIYGSYPAEYQVQTTGCYGVAKGSAKSLAVVDGVLYYLSNHGLCAYDGALPTPVSQAWGKKRFHDGVAGSYGSKYYLSALDEEEKPSLLVYDTVRNLWHREDDFRAKEFCSWGRQLLGYDGEVVYSMILEDASSPQVNWMAQTGVLSVTDTRCRYINRLLARLSMEQGARVRFYARYDGSGDWELLGSMESKGIGVVRLPMRTRRCESLELRLEGVGKAQLYSLVLMTQTGSD